MQAMLLQKFGSKGVCLDSTHGTTSYDFLLFGAGCPVGWCLSNHDDTTAMTIFIQEIKKRCGTIEPVWLMSDMANQLYNWVGVMGNRPRKHNCSWHVDRHTTND